MRRLSRRSPGHHSAEGGDRSATPPESREAAATVSIEPRSWALGAEAERRRIAGELHDRVAPTLAVLGLELDRLRRHGADDELRPGIDRVRADVRTAMEEVREILGELRRDLGDVPGAESLDPSSQRVGRRRSPS